MKRLLTWFCVVSVMVGIAVVLTFSGGKPRATASFLNGKSPTEEGRGQSLTKRRYAWAVYVLNGDDKEVLPWKNELKSAGWKETPSGMGAYSILFERANGAQTETCYMLRDMAVEDFWWTPDRGMGWGGSHLNGKISLAFVTYEQRTLFERLFSWLGV